MSITNKKNSRIQIFGDIDFVSLAETGYDNWKKILFYDQTTTINFH